MAPSVPASPRAAGSSGLDVKTLPPFKLERFFARKAALCRRSGGGWEFTAQHQLCCSDSQPLQMSQLLAGADADALERWEGLSLAYTETQGLPALREAVAQVHYTGILPEEVVVGAPEELIYLAMQALLRPGDHVVVTYPGYQSLYEVARSLGCDVDYWEATSADDGSLAFDVASFPGIMRHTTKLVVTNFPHNPTGFLPTQEDWQRVVDACKSRGAYLFSDEMYRTLELDPTDRLPAAADCYQNAISLSGLSKAVGLPGLRIGWLASHDAPLLQRVLQLKDYTTICNSAPSEILGLMALRQWDALVEGQLALIRSNLATLEAFFARWEALFQWRAPRAGTIAFPRLVSGEDVGAWCEEVVQGSGVLLMPGSVYDHQPSAEQGRFRIGFSRANMPECLEKLESFLQQRQGGRARE